MTSQDCLTPLDDRSRFDPRSMFRSPEAVVANPGLTAEQKADVLLVWAYDASEMAVAEEEGMRGGDDDLQRRTRLALERVTSGRMETAPTKQHGIQRVIRR